MYPQPPILPPLSSFGDICIASDPICVFPCEGCLLGELLMRAVPDKPMTTTTKTTKTGKCLSLILAQPRCIKRSKANPHHSGEKADTQNCTVMQSQIFGYSAVIMIFTTWSEMKGWRRKEHVWGAGGSSSDTHVVHLSLFTGSFPSIPRPWILEFSPTSPYNIGLKWIENILPRKYSFNISEYSRSFSLTFLLWKEIKLIKKFTNTEKQKNNNKTLHSPTHLWTTMPPHVAICPYISLLWKLNHINC